MILAGSSSKGKKASSCAAICFGCTTSSVLVAAGADHLADPDAADLARADLARAGDRRLADRVAMAAAGGPTASRATASTTATAVANRRPASGRSQTDNRRSKPCFDAEAQDRDEAGLRPTYVTRILIHLLVLGAVLDFV